MQRREALIRTMVLAAILLVVSCRKSGKDWVVLPEGQALELMHPCSRSFPSGLSGYWKLTGADVDRAQQRFQDALRRELKRLPEDERDGVPSVYNAQYAGFFRDGRRVIYVNAVGDSPITQAWRDRAILICDGGAMSFGAILDRDTVDSFEFNGTFAGPIRMIDSSRQ